MFARVLAVANRKGGTGKSTVAVNLAAELGARGYHVLVADLDPQGHAGLGFGIEMPDASRTIHAAFRDEQVELAGAICATSEPGVDLIAADRNFDGRILLSDPRCLARAIAPIKPNYDVVLLDSPPVAANLSSAPCSPRRACWCQPHSTILHLMVCASSRDRITTLW